MRVIAKKTLRDFWEKHPDSESQLRSWYYETVNSDWNSPNDIKRRYSSASILHDNRVVFNIKGNTYRLVTKVNYDYGIVWIRFLGTHSEYDKINSTEV